MSKVTVTLEDSEWSWITGSLNHHFDFWSNIVKFFESGEVVVDESTISGQNDVGEAKFLRDEYLRLFRLIQDARAKREFVENPGVTEVGAAPAELSVLESLKELSAWMREHTGHRDGTLDMLIRATGAMAGVVASGPATPGRTDYEYRTTCPKCNHRDCLVVFEVRHCASGQMLWPESKLTTDGFEVDTKDELPPSMDQSTTDEKVRCDSCGEIFDLVDLHN
jgi:hypothetical protein